MKRVIFFTVVIISIFIIQNMVRSIYGLWQKHDLLAQAESELAKQKQENSRLKQQLTTVESTNFIEQEARNKLFMQRAGESRVMVDRRLIDAVMGDKTEVKKDLRPNWQQWWELFF